MLFPSIEVRRLPSSAQEKFNCSDLALLPEIGPYCQIATLRRALLGQSSCRPVCVTWTLDSLSASTQIPSASNFPTSIAVALLSLTFLSSTFAVYPILSPPPRPLRTKQRYGSRHLYRQVTTVIERLRKKKRRKVVVIFIANNRFKTSPLHQSSSTPTFITARWNRLHAPFYDLHQSR